MDERSEAQIHLEDLHKAIQNARASLREMRKWVTSLGQPALEAIEHNLQIATGALMFVRDDVKALERDRSVFDD